MKANRKINSPRTINNYLTVLFLLGVVATVGFSLLSILQLKEIRSIEERRVAQVADEEIESLLQDMSTSILILANSYSNWDETKQQLSNSNFYSYWRTNRVKEVSFSVPHLRDVELFDSRKVSLEGSSIRLEPDVELGELDVAKRGDIATLWTVLAVVDESQPGFNWGFVKVTVDLGEMFHRARQLQSLDVATLKLNLPEDKTIKFANIRQYLEYQQDENEYVVESGRLLVKTVLYLGGFFLVLMMLWSFLLRQYIALPLTGLVSWIDKLSGRHINDEQLEIVNSLDVKVSEIEKVRESILNYNYNIVKGEEALTESQMRNKAILDNVADAILTIDELDRVTSVNQGAEVMFGYTKEELFGEKISRLFASNPLDGELSKSKLPKKLSIRIPQESYELLALRKNGEKFPVEMLVKSAKVNSNSVFIVFVRDVGERKKNQQELLYLANYDPLTNLPNRLFFREHIEFSMEVADANSTLVAVLFLDLDRFKNVNDTLGHQMGDSLLVVVAKRLQTVLSENCTIARLGGDEFAIVMEKISNVSEVEDLATRVLESLVNPFSIQGQQIFINSSIGITVYPFDDTNAENLLRNADTAMFKAKEQGGGVFEFYTQDMNKVAERWAILEKNLRQAMHFGEFYLCYQPRFNLRKDQVAGFEALLRWESQELGVVSPFEFIPVLESTGMMPFVGEWVLREACRFGQRLEKELGHRLRVSVNVSKKQFEQNSFIDMIHSVLSGFVLGPNYLELEITESLMMEDVGYNIRQLEKISNMGITVSIDDFGTGYSSLSYLKRFPIDILKIDRSFVKDITTDPDDAVIASAIVAMARSLNLKITAEGVETEEQLQHLKSLGCDEAQGYYLGMPMTEAEFVGWLRNFDQERLTNEKN